MTALVWLRDDLRIADHPALHAAASSDSPLVVFYLLDEETPGIRPLGGAARWWLHHSLTALATDLQALGATLVLRRGPAETVVPALVAETGAEHIHWIRRYGRSREADARLTTALESDGITVHDHQGNLLTEPGSVLTGQGTPYRVFTPFWKATLALGEPRHPLPAPSKINAAPVPASDDLDDWDLLPTSPDWAGGLRDSWQPGENAAHAQLETFTDDSLEDYADHRDEPAVDATSRLSPRLRWGELSPFQIWHHVTRVAQSPKATTNAEAFLRQITWREFNWNILFHQPDLATDNFRPEYDAFPWDAPDRSKLAAWRHGRTGIPLVDAGMRELWHTGVMHNRVRLVTASFLVKNLLVDWRIGEAWFWDTLVDADEANNPANWQWVAGSGADAAPYFRVFNPVLQADRFDKRRAYQAKWIPELGTDEYPEQIVDIKRSREGALDAYSRFTRSGA